MKLDPHEQRDSGCPKNGPNWFNVKSYEIVGFCSNAPAGPKCAHNPIQLLRDYHPILGLGQS